MFYLGGRCSRSGKNCAGAKTQDEFGWWLNDQGIQSTSSPIKNSRPTNASTVDDVSIECCCPTSQANGYVYARDFTSCNCQTSDEEGTGGNKSEKIEMLPLDAGDVDLLMIESDAGHFYANNESISESVDGKFNWFIKINH